MEQLNIYHNNKELQMYVHSNPNDHISRMIKLNNKFYESELLSFLQAKFYDQTNIVDIGANIGNHSLFFANFMSCQKIFAFEPFLSNISLFKLNLAQHSNCILYETALSDMNTKLPLYNTENGNFGGFSLHKQNKSFKVCSEIDVAKLDDFNLTDVTLIKIDVENHETEVLCGGIQTILKHKPTIILENSSYYFGNIFSDPDPHKQFFDRINYAKLYSNVCQSSMDIWISK